MRVFLLTLWFKDSQFLLHEGEKVPGEVIAFGKRELAEQRLAEEKLEGYDGIIIEHELKLIVSEKEDDDD